ncbi:MAG: site-specific integrase [Candidatus Bathyarchaeia archaeon]
MAKVKKRKVADVPIFLDESLWDQLKEAVDKAGSWNYKVNADMLRLRDRALAACLILTGCRVSEVLDLKRGQFRVYRDRIVLANVETKKHGEIRSRITMPFGGRLGWFTRVVADWLMLVPNDSNVYVFPRFDNNGNPMWNKPMSRKRVHQLIKECVGLFPHWFRGVCETIYARLVFRRDAWKLKQWMGLKRLDSTVPYVGGSWEEDEERIFEI